MLHTFWLKLSPYNLPAPLKTAPKLNYLYHPAPASDFCRPALRVTNDDLSRIMDTSDEWIRSRTGIGVRHAAVEETTRSMSVDAARQALEEAGIQPEELFKNAL